DDIKYFNRNTIKLARFIKDKYNCRYIDAIKCFIPPEVDINVKKKIVVNENVNETNLSKEEKDVLEKIVTSKLNINVNDIYESKKVIDRLRKKGAISFMPDISYGIGHKKVRMVKLRDISFDNLSEKERDFIELLRGREWIAASELVNKKGISYSFINRLHKKGLIDYEYRESRRRVEFPHIVEKEYPLNSYQLKTLSCYYNAKEKGKSKFLLYGVSNSGKTDVYMRIAQNTLNEDKSVLILVPEISLTPQLIARFTNRFGDKVAVFHSRLSDGQHFDEWDRVRQGDAMIAIGTRSAVFLPMKNLGLIVIDEEHDNGFKQSDMYPFYDAREIAEKRCEIEGASFILCSSTPSMETYYKARTGELELLHIPVRVNNLDAPQYSIVDLRRELKRGNKGILSTQLITEIEMCLKNGEQAILFLNKRGYASFVMCQDCGHIFKCPHCDITLSYHSDRKILTCHYCNYTRPVAQNCPECGAKELEFKGFGTQKLEKEINRFFPEARVLRLDRDSLKGINSLNQIYTDFRNKKADILIGTQLITKGFDFPGVTLAAVIMADINLNLPDFRSAESTFQLITQLGGRVGRGDKRGKVIIQTFNAEHYSIQYAAKNDYTTFYKKEIAFREKYGYPPFVHLGRTLCTGLNEEQVRKAIELWYNDIESKINNNSLNGIKLLRPVPCPVPKINDFYRWQIVIKGSEENVLSRIIADSYNNIEKFDGVKYMMDINPVNLM
ncbi:MAG: primosomal protein N', partial [Thermoanaerobacteraceae bacterium]|nr:primosomal protein N' [Thermoanaerobacteraceae bacterium]